MSHVQVSDVTVSVVVAGTQIARFDFHHIERSPQEWEITSTLIEPDARQATRACLLAALAVLQSFGWEDYSYPLESGGETNDQPQLPWE